MKNRLVELLYEAEGQVNNDLPSLEQIADYLLANGVIVPPCKVGDIVYIIGAFTGQKVFDTVQSITFTGDGVCLNLKCGAVVVPQQLGKTVFLTKEEAEKALAERSNR